MYQMNYGSGDNADVLLECLGLTRQMVPRFRACFIDNGRIAIRTRTGGYNREFAENEATARRHFPEDFSEGVRTPKGPWNDDLRGLPYYLYDEDWEMDNTYATFYFCFPIQFKEKLELLEEQTNHEHQ
jgi:hypothetical protein